MIKTASQTHPFLLSYLFFTAVGSIMATEQNMEEKQKEMSLELTKETWTKFNKNRQQVQEIYWFHRRKNNKLSPDAFFFKLLGTNAYIAKKAIEYKCIDAINIILILLRNPDLDHQTRMDKITTVLDNGTALNDRSRFGELILDELFESTSDIKLGLFEFFLKRGLDPNKKELGEKHWLFAFRIFETQQPMELLTLFLQYGFDTCTTGGWLKETLLHRMVTLQHIKVIVLLCNYEREQTFKKTNATIPYWCKHEEVSSHWPKALNFMIAKYVGNRLLQIQEIYGLTPLDLAYTLRTAKSKGNKPMDRIIWLLEQAEALEILDCKNQQPLRMSLTLGTLGSVM